MAKEADQELDEKCFGWGGGIWKTDSREKIKVRSLKPKGDEEEPFV